MNIFRNILSIWLGLTILVGNFAPQALPIVQTGGSIGYECGIGEQLLANTLCLYGQVFWQPVAGGTLTPVSGAIVTVSVNGSSLQTVSSLRPGKSQPSYALEIQDLHPNFLQPVQVRVEYQSKVYTREVSFYPNFETQSQNFDVRLYAAVAFDQPAISGMVVDFGSGGPVSGASVRLEYAGKSQTLQTGNVNQEPYPTYAFTWPDLQALGAEAGKTATLSATYNGDTVRKQIVLPDPNGDGIQVNLVTHWKCEDFDPLPRSSGGDGFPRSSGGDGFPDLVCFWGYANIDGHPGGGVQIEIETGGQTVSGLTHPYSGEADPRYGIAMWDAHSRNGQPAALTAIYMGTVVKQNFTIQMDVTHSQRNDTIINSVSIEEVLDTGWVTGLTLQDNFLWMGTANGGALRWNLQDNSYTHFTAADGLLDNTINAIERDPAGRIWFLNGGGLSRYNPITNIWVTFPKPIGFMRGTTIMKIAPDSSFWFGSGYAFYHCDATFLLEIMTCNSNSVSDKSPINAITLDPSGNVWIGTGYMHNVYSGGLYRYDPVNKSLVEFSFPQFPVGPVSKLVSLPNGDIWFSGTRDLYNGSNAVSDAAVTRYRAATNTFEYMGTDWGYGASLLALDSKQHLWLADLSSPNPRIKDYDITDEQWLTPCSMPGWSAATVMSAVSSPQGKVYVVARSPTTRNLILYDFSASYCDEGSTTPLIDTFFYPQAKQFRAAVLPNEHILISNTNYYDNGTSKTNVVDYDPTTHIGQFLDSGVCNSVIQSIVLDNHNQAWFVAGGCISQLNLTTGMWSTPPYPECRNNIPEITFGGDSFWAFCRSTTSYLYRYDDISKLWQTINSGYNLDNSSAGSIYYDPAGRIWLLLGNGTGWFYNIVSGTTTIFNYPRDFSYGVVGMAFTTDGHAWLGTGRKVFEYLPTTQAWVDRTTAMGLAMIAADNVKNTRITAIGQDQSGDIWLHVIDDSAALFLFHYNPALGQGQQYTQSAFTGSTINTTYSHCYYNPPPTNNYSNTCVPQINMILKDGQNGLWFGFSPNRLVHWNVSTIFPDLAAQIHVSAQSALPGETVTVDLGVVNQGAGAAESVQIALQLQPAANGQSPSTFALGNILPGASVSQTAQVTMPSDSPPGTVLALIATASSASSEDYVENNTARTTLTLSAPSRPDVRAGLFGPSTLTPGATAEFYLWTGNSGTLLAQNTSVQLNLPAGLEFVSAVPAPNSMSPLIWNLGDRPAASSPDLIKINLRAAANAPTGAQVKITARANTSTLEDNTLNNDTSLTLAVGSPTFSTLVLTAPQRTVQQGGISNTVFDTLSRWAQHAAVNAWVLDVGRDAATQAAYDAWDADPGDSAKVNAVAQAIRAQVQSALQTHPELRYLVIIGGDSVIPFYRVSDRAESFWLEKSYSRRLSSGTLRSALDANDSLTDDYYAASQALYPVTLQGVDGYPVWVPDLPSGRLIGAPSSIDAALSAFLQSNGEITLNKSLVAGDATLAGDLQAEQCRVFNQDDISTDCTQTESSFSASALKFTSGGIWAAFHSSHDTLGQLKSSQLTDLAWLSRYNLFATIGCHAGLPANSSDGTPGLVEAMQTPGITYVAPTGYAYGSVEGIGFSEQLMLSFANKLTKGSSQEVGTALMSAKQEYYALKENISGQDWFTFLDAKVINQMELYGLPMTRVITPNLLSASTSLQTEALSAGIEIAPFVRNNLFNRHETTGGVYYDIDDIDGNVTSDQSLPVQPAINLPFEKTRGDKVIKGVWVKRVDFAEKTNFTPLLGQAWAIGEPFTPLAKISAAPLTGWDRSLPFGIGMLPGNSTGSAMFNIVAGAYHAPSRVERLYTRLELQVVYGSSQDSQPPTLLHGSAYASPLGWMFSALVADDPDVMQVQVVYEIAGGSWQGLPLQNRGNGIWTATGSDQPERFFIQVMDSSGNITTGAWQAVSQSSSIYLPSVRK
jgi:hypothetical protein